MCDPGDTAKCHSLEEAGAVEHISHCATVVYLVLIMIMVVVVTLVYGCNGCYNGLKMRWWVCQKGAEMGL